MKIFKLESSEIEVKIFNNKEKILLDVINTYIQSYKNNCLEGKRTNDYLFHQKKEIEGLMLSLFFMDLIKFPLFLRSPYRVAKNSESIVYYCDPKKEVI